MPVGLLEGRPTPGTLCRLRSLRLFLLVVVVLMLGQFSFNMLFYRNYESLFYVNSTSISPFFSLDSRLWWTSSNIRWLQSPPVKPANHTWDNSTSPIKNSVKEDVGRGVTQEVEVTGEGAKVEVRTSVKLPVKDLNESDIERTKESGKQSPSHTAVPLKYSTKPKIETSDGGSGKASTATVGSLVLGSGSNKTLLNNSKPSVSDNVTQAKPTPEKPLCPPVPPQLIGVVEVSKTSPTLEAQERTHLELDPGGHHKPESCTARHKVAIIIPYRDRVSHLAVFLYHMHPILQRQQLDYTIFVVEQAGNGKFNRAMLMNVGALEALKQYPFSCFVFHDVDLLPEDDRNLYTCPEQPRHMSIAIDTMKYRLPYNDIFGGVSAMTVKQFRTVNGFSNKFWGWGGEDDDMSNRIKHHHYHISRYPANVGRYTMLTHKKDSPNPRRYQYLHEGKKRYKTDGLNSVKYRTLDTQLRRLYTWVYVDLFPS